MAKATMLVVLLGLIAAGAFGLYYYLTPAAKIAPNPGAGTTTVALGSLADGRQAFQVSYNGSTYQAAVKLPNSPTFSCPTGTDPTLCTLLQQTCGNGVGSDKEPWKTCYNCPFDAGCSGAESCDPYTHRCSVLSGACQVAVYGGQ